MKNSQEYYAEPALEELAENGDAAVKLEVGKVFASMGNSNYKSKAKKYITKAAELGNAEALFCLGKEKYESGDKFKGKACLASAANHGYQPAKELLANYERDEKEARAAEEAKAAEEEQAKLEGRWLPSISWIKANNWNIYSDGKWNEGAIKRFSAVCQGDLKAAMGLPDMDELDLLRYKQSGQYQQDLNTLKQWKDEHYAYIVDILNEDYYRTHPIVFTTNSFTIPESLGEIILPNLEKINLRLWRGRIMIPLKDGVIKELNKDISYNFKCDDIDKLYSIKSKSPDLALVFLFKPAYSKAMNITTYSVEKNKVVSKAEKLQYNFANTVAIYLVEKSTDTVILDLSSFKRDITSPAEVQRNAAALIADQKVVNQRHLAAKPKYHQKPKRELCFFCGGLGINKERTAKCLICKGLGYFLEHYY